MPAEPGHDLRLSLDLDVQTDRRRGAPRGHRERADGLRRELGEEPRRERRCRRRARSGRQAASSRWRRGRPTTPRGSCGAHRGPALPAVPEPAGADAQPRHADHLRPRIDVQALRRARGLEGGDRVVRVGPTTVPPSTSTRATSPAPSSTTGTVRAPGLLSIAQWSQGLVRHAVLQVRERLLLPRRADEQEELQRSHEAMGLRPRTEIDLPAEAVGHRTGPRRT